MGPNTYYKYLIGEWGWLELPQVLIPVLDRKEPEKSHQGHEGCAGVSVFKNKGSEVLQGVRAPEGIGLSDKPLSPEKQ